jgi:deoxyribodipyrimidine photolyase-related protein
MKKGRILLPNQLFSFKYIPEPKKFVVVSDHMWFTHEKPFNTTTLVHKFISSHAYANVNNVKYFWVGEHTPIRKSNVQGPFTQACKYLKSLGVNIVHIFDPIDQPLVQSIQRICKREKIELGIDDTPAFLETNKDLDEYLKEHPPKKIKGIRSYSHTPFYKWQRTRLNLLMTKDGKPIGGKLTYDTENRDPFPKDLTTDPSFVKPLPLPKGISIKDVNTIVKYVHTEFKDNPGTISGTIKSTKDLGAVNMYPMNNSQAISHLKTFLKKSLPNFGKYEDAIHPNITYGYHSVLSSSLNNGLLTPSQVLDEIKKIITTHSKKLNGDFLASIEGFIRQIFGWRSYCRLIYREERDVMMRSNYLKHTKRLPKSWFRNEEITTKIPWLDTMFKNSYSHAYAHHIVRLMVFSQWFLLMRIHPRDVLDWFWSVVSIDAYEWVMVPNVLGMGQYADGGIMMTRPYVSSSTYLEKMSRKTLKGDVKIGKKEYTWQDVWRALYYDFLMNQEKRLGNMYAYSSSYARLRKTSETQKKEWKAISKKYRK